MSIETRSNFCKYLLPLATVRPYLIPFIEKYMLTDSNSNEIALVITPLFNNAIHRKATDALAYSIYYSIKYDFDLEISNTIVDNLIEIDDCISLLLLYKYLKLNYQNDNRESLISQLYNNAATINDMEYLERDKYWLFIYEVLPEVVLKDTFLKKLKQQNVEFVTFSPNNRNRRTTEVINDLDGSEDFL